MRIADTEGFAAVSMRRIAAELDAGTMTLYHYVRTKDELLTLVVDAVMGEVVIPDDEPIPDDWRAALTLIAERVTRVRSNGTRGSSTSPTTRRSARTACATSTSRCRRSRRSPLDLADKFDIVSVVDEYVFGFCLHHRNNQTQQPASSNDDMVAYVNRLVETGDYPQLAALARSTGSKRRGSRSRRTCHPPASAATSSGCSTASRRISSPN